MKLKIGCLIILLVFALSLSGCSTIYNPATGRNEWIFISDDQEIDIGQGVVKEVVKKYPLYENRNVQDFVQRVGSSVASVSDRPEMPYEFKVIDDDTINAFACPGGFIYIHKGLLDKLNDDELAFVLAHEVGHVAARHSVKRIQANLGFQFVLALAFVGSGLAGDKGVETAGSIADFSSTLYNLVALGYSREDEYLADSLGIKYAALAGYDPEGSIGALEKLKQEGGLNIPFLSTHPPIDERIIKAKEYIANQGFSQ